MKRIVIAIWAIIGSFSASLGLSAVFPSNYWIGVMLFEGLAWGCMGLYLMWSSQYIHWKLNRRKSPISAWTRLKRTRFVVKWTDTPQRSKAGWGLVYTLALTWCGIWFYVDSLFGAGGLLVWIICTIVYLPITIWKIRKKIKRQGYKPFKQAVTDALENYARHSSPSSWRYVSKLGSPIGRGKISFGNIRTENFYHTHLEYNETYDRWEEVND